MDRPLQILDLHFFAKIMVIFTICPRFFFYFWLQRTLIRFEYEYKIEYFTFSRPAYN